MSFTSKIRSLGLQSLRVDAVREHVARARFIYYGKLRRKLTALDSESEGVAPNTIFHNKRGLSDLAVNRSHMLVRPLSVIESLGPNSDILTIGPRTEGELLNLFAHGFSPAHVRGLDLISYSPWIDLGNMHHLPYPDNSWDAVVLGWVLAYSTNQKLVADEIVRVVRPHGVVAIGVEYNPKSDMEIQEAVGYQVGAQRRLTRTDHILELFGSRVEYVYFRHDVMPSRLDQVGSVCVVFSVDKSKLDSPIS